MRQSSQLIVHSMCGIAFCVCVCVCATTTCSKAESRICFTKKMSILKTISHFVLFYSLRINRLINIQRYFLRKLAVMRKTRAKWKKKIRQVRWKIRHRRIEPVAWKRERSCVRAHIETRGHPRRFEWLSGWRDVSTRWEVGRGFYRAASCVNQLSGPPVVQSDRSIKTDEP